jgi:hypothetical protein
MAILGGVQSQTSFRRITTMEVDSSLLASAFNTLLNEALNKRDEGMADWLLLLHSDVVPMNTQFWIDELWRARQRSGADAISAVIPIKDSRGLTSTALETDNLYAPRRLTMREIEEQDETFTDEKLLINTGMLLINLRAPWADNICFTIGDAMLLSPSGKRLTGVTPEDWTFSRHVKEQGGKVWATRAVKLNHVGRFTYPNFGSWGSESLDPGDNRE